MQLEGLLRCTDAVGGSPPTCAQQIAGASSEDNREQKHPIRTYRKIINLQPGVESGHLSQQTVLRFK